VVKTPTLPQQALLYRLCGDRNPLHADPDFAATAGFPRPILHGLCTWAMTCKAVVDTVLDGDPTRVGSYSAKFAGIVFPGETLETHIWRESDHIVLTTSVPERDTLVLSEGRLTPTRW
jgi:acyl dehydratase